MRQNICISIERGLLDHIDSERGNVPRSREIESLVIKGIEFGNIVSCSQNALEEKEEGDARSDKSAKTEAPCIPSSTLGEVDK